MYNVYLFGYKPYIHIWMPKDSTGLFGAGVTGNCDQPDMGVGN